MNRSNFKALFLIHIFGAALANDVTLECAYKSNQIVWNVLNSTFTTCQQTNLRTFGTIKEAIGFPLIIPNKDVQMYIVDNRIMQQLPLGLQNVLPNLVGIKINNTDFNFLNVEALKGINGLKYLGILNSKLEIILDATFAYSPSLELLDLSGNPIYYLSSSIFDDLKGLKYLYLDVLCLFGSEFESSIILNSSNIENVKELVKGRCMKPQWLQIALNHSLRNSVNMFEELEYYKLSNDENLQDYEEDKKALRAVLNIMQAEITECYYDKDTLINKITFLEQTIDKTEDKTCYPSGTCIFKTNSVGYSCMARLYVKAAFEQNINWTGIHVSGQNDDAVLSIVIQSQVMEVFPLNIGSTFKSIKDLIVRNSGLTRIRATDFKSLSKLENLEITGNNIASIDATAFSGLTLLKTIDLSFNNITVLPSLIFEPLLSIKIINLSDNKLKQLRFDVISNGNSIQEINLSNNEVVPLDRTFIWRLQKAVKIDLSGTGCAYSLDKLANPEVTFYAFYTNIIMNC